MPDLVTALRSGLPVLAAELRPPRAELGSTAGMDAWIDTYQAVRGVTRHDHFVCLTDSAVGAAEEDNLRHLVTNLGAAVSRDRVVPFLTTKHPIEYCLGYADRAAALGFPALVVLGGDRKIGPPRSVSHAWELRREIAARQPKLQLGGWANPHADAARQVGYLADPRVHAQFFLTQIVSHHQRDDVERFVREMEQNGPDLPGLFGVFYYRSANPRTLRALEDFIPVPAAGLSRDFASGTTPAEECARTIRMLHELGVRHVYVSNLPPARAGSTLSAVMDLVPCSGSGVR